MVLQKQGKILLLKIKVLIKHSHKIKYFFFY